MASRFDPADFADGGQRAFRLDHQADQLDDAAAGFGRPHLLHALQGGLEVQWMPSVSAWRSCFQRLADQFELGFPAGIDDTEAGLHQAPAGRDVGGRLEPHGFVARSGQQDRGIALCSRARSSGCR